MKIKILKYFIKIFSATIASAASSFTVLVRNLVRNPKLNLKNFSSPTAIAFVNLSYGITPLYNDSA